MGLFNIPTACFIFLPRLNNPGIWCIMNKNTGIGGQNLKRNDIERKIGAGALALLAAILAVRALYGFCWSDESFYLTFAQRLWNGQRLILDEWHPVQFYSVIFYPVLTLYRAIRGTEGIYLFARLLYLLLAFGVSELVLFTFSKEERVLPGFLCAASVLAYSRGNIWGLSYYNLFLLLMLTALCLAVRGRGKRLLSVLSGVCLGFAVLCVPYFTVFVVPTLIWGFWKKEHRTQTLWIALGIVLSAAYFLLLFLPKDLGAVASSLKTILSDPEHSSGPAANFVAAVENVRLIYLRDILLAVFCAALLWAVRKLLPGKAWAEVPALILVCLGAFYSFWRCRKGETGFAAYSFCIYALVLFRWDDSQKLDLLLRRVGAAMAVAMAMSSNTEAIGFTVGLCVYSMGLVLPLSRAQEGRRAVCLVLSCLMVSITFCSRVTTVFRDGPLGTLTETMESGPAAGIRTTKESKEQYDQVLSMLEDLEGKYGRGNSVFFTKLLPWGYLACDFPCGAPTAWRTELSSPRLEDYYESHPKAIPTIVVVLDPEIGRNPDPDMAAPNENTLGGWLWDYMQEHSYTETQYSCARVYISPDAV